MYGAKTKALISCAIFGFVFAYADCWFTGAASHLSSIDFNAAVNLFALEFTENWVLYS